MKTESRGQDGPFGSCQRLAWDQVPAEAAVAPPHGRHSRKTSQQPCALACGRLCSCCGCQPRAAQAAMQALGASPAGQRESSSDRSASAMRAAQQGLAQRICCRSASCRASSSSMGSSKCLLMDTCIGTEGGGNETTSKCLLVDT